MLGVPKQFFFFANLILVTAIVKKKKRNNILKCPFMAWFSLDFGELLELQCLCCYNPRPVGTSITNLDSQESLNLPVKQVNS